MKDSPRDSLSLRCLPQAVRIANALVGNAAGSKKLTSELLRQSLKAAPRWRDESEAARWFARHTVLLAREITAVAVDPDQDPLLSLTKNPLHQLILRTLRFLPSQQREAYFLTHGERFTPRLLATAMDCSIEAASTHLRAAERSLNPLTSADSLNEFNNALPQLLQQSAPSQEQLILQFQQAKSSGLWKKLFQWLSRTLRFSTDLN